MNGWVLPRSRASSLVLALDGPRTRGRKGACEWLETVKLKLGSSASTSVGTGHLRSHVLPMRVGTEASICLHTRWLLSSTHKVCFRARHGTLHRMGTSFLAPSRLGNHSNPPRIPFRRRRWTRPCGGHVPSGGPKRWVRLLLGSDPFGEETPKPPGRGKDRGGEPIGISTWFGRDGDGDSHGIGAPLRPCRVPERVLDEDGRMHASHGRFCGRERSRGSRTGGARERRRRPSRSEGELAKRGASPRRS